MIKEEIIALKSSTDLSWTTILNLEALNDRFILVWDSSAMHIHDLVWVNRTNNHQSSTRTVRFTHEEYWIRMSTEEFYIEPNGFWCFQVFNNCLSWINSGFQSYPPISTTLYLQELSNSWNSKSKGVQRNNASTPLRLTLNRFIQLLQRSNLHLATWSSSIINSIM